MHAHAHTCTHMHTHVCTHALTYSQVVAHAVHGSLHLAWKETTTSFLTDERNQTLKEHHDSPLEMVNKAQWHM